MRVSVATLSRWRSGQSRPRPRHERRLMTLTADTAVTYHKVDLGPIADGIESSLQGIEAHVIEALSSIRELFHSHSHFSSQHDCLDFIASLFFAHVSSLERGGPGISSELTRECSSAAASLSAFVRDTYESSLSDTQIVSLDERCFSLGLDESENEFALLIIREMERISGTIRAAHEHGRDDILNAIFSRFVCGSFVDEKEMGQYLTPPEIVQLMTSQGLNSLSDERRRILTRPSEVSSAGLILDPSCGVGSFLGAAAQCLYADARKNASGEELSKWLRVITTQKIIGFDKSKRMAHLAITNLSLFGAHGVQVHRLNALLRNEPLTSKVAGNCWLILTNPPFGAEYSGEDVRGYQIAGSRSGAGRSMVSELLFVERYVEWLAPGGILVSVVPDNLLTGQGNYAEARDFLRRHCDILSVVSLPSVTFSAAGTSTKTSLLTLRKKNGVATVPNTYFGVCGAVGFDVVTRGGYRRRRPIPENDLAQVGSELAGHGVVKVGRWALLPANAKRWDAIYHAHPSLNAVAESRVAGDQLPAVSQVAKLIDLREHPQRLFNGTFPYIEISDIDPRTGWVNAKDVPVSKAPSRARKLVRAGDVLVSTVRPERGAVGVVPDDLDGAICSTGLAVLRPEGIEPYLLRRLLVTRFVIGQMERHNVGIAYPAISERELLAFKLPVPAEDLEELAPASRMIGNSMNSTRQMIRGLDDLLSQRSQELSR